ncbi:hypothetical protein A2715_02450 [Candidatus Woesebacteria bacterium RIFCSPHIGHO2_01_FULL_39_32]|nr:MAG: hypothetical protein A2715_02450 [Candidatus Woesebacteria bacterium RIFCSPHIGHO2_01_FULL_39_32]
MKLSLKPNFFLTLSDLFTNLSAGWFGAILILPGIWTSYDLQSNLIRFTGSLVYGISCFYFSFYLKELANGN